MKIDEAIEIIERKAARIEVMAMAPRTSAPSRIVGAAMKREVEAMRLLIAEVRKRARSDGEAVR